VCRGAHPLDFDADADAEAEAEAEKIRNRSSACCPGRAGANRSLFWRRLRAVLPSGRILTFGRRARSFGSMARRVTEYRPIES